VCSRALSCLSLSLRSSSARSLQSLAGAREAPHASRPSTREGAQPPALVRAKRRTLAPQRAPSSSAACPGAREAPHARASARAKQLSRLPGTKTTSEVLDDQITICDRDHTHESRQDRRLLSLKSRQMPGAQTKPHKKGPNNRASIPGSLKLPTNRQERELVVRLTETTEQHAHDAPQDLVSQVFV
jgi:hypothetical protein